MLGLHKECVSLQLVSHEEYEQAYQEEYEKLACILKGYYVVIEHVGSTAIPGIMAKPIIDIAVGIKDIADFDSITFILQSHGFVYLVNNGDSTRRVFVKTNNDVRTHHIHIEEYGKESWTNHVLFKEKLLLSERLRKEYEDLKVQLSIKYVNDRKKYTSEKAEFIQRVLHEL